MRDQQKIYIYTQVLYIGIVSTIEFYRYVICYKDILNYTLDVFNVAT